MSGAKSRNKGAKGQREFKEMLADRDWIADQITAGIAAADMIATDLGGVTWAVEVKNCVGILASHKKQAMEQGRIRRLPWMLASKIAGSSSWLIQRKGELPQVWHDKKELKNGN